MPRSAVRDCIHCGNKIFFDDTILKGRPLEYDQNNNIKPHTCKEFVEKPADKKTESSTMIRVIMDLRKDMDKMKDDMKKVKAKLGIEE